MEISLQLATFILGCYLTYTVLFVPEKLPKTTTYFFDKEGKEIFYGDELTRGTDFGIVIYLKGPKLDLGKYFIELEEALQGFTKAN